MGSEQDVLIPFLLTQSFCLSPHSLWGWFIHYHHKFRNTSPCSLYPHCPASLRERSQYVVSFCANVFGPQTEQYWDGKKNCPAVLKRFSLAAHLKMFLYQPLKPHSGYNCDWASVLSPPPPISRLFNPWCTLTKHIRQFPDSPKIESWPIGGPYRTTLFPIWVLHTETSGVPHGTCGNKRLCHWASKLSRREHPDCWKAAQPVTPWPAHKIPLLVMDATFPLSLLCYWWIEGHLACAWKGGVKIR